MSVATVPSLIRASSSSLLQPLGVAGAVGGQVGTQPGVVPQPADLGGRDERGPQHAPLVQLAQPHRIQLVGLGPARQVLDVTGIHQPHHQPPRLQHIDERPPIVGGRLHHHPLDPLPGQLVGQLQDLVGSRGDLPDPGAALARLGGMRHAGADHAGRLGDVDRGDPFQDLLVVFDLDLLACWHRPSSSHHGSQAGCPGARLGYRNSDRRARGNSARPCCRAPAPDSGTASNGQGHIGVGGQPDPFSRLHGVPQGILRLRRKCPAAMANCLVLTRSTRTSPPSRSSQRSRGRLCCPSSVRGGPRP